MFKWMNKNPINKFMIFISLDCVNKLLRNKSKKYFLVIKDRISQSIDIFNWYTLDSCNEA